MDYEKKYKEALGRAKTLIEKLESNHIKSFIYDIFPELKESYDEKIRKELIAIYSVGAKGDMKTGDIPDRAIVAWLEKQGEQKPQGKSAIEAIKEEKVDNANKVKSPFHEGDWIVTNNTKIVLLIKYYSFYLNSYTFEDTNGHTFFPCVAPTKEDYHLWSIKDAKDGDVLQLGKVTAIFQDYISNKECRCYCSVFDGEFKIPIQYADTYGCHNAVPATKEQRDILMKAMADSGYTFDFERKELKKIKDETEIPFGAKDSELQEDIYYIPKGFHAEINEDIVVIKKGEKSIDDVWHDNKCIPDNDDKEILVEYNLNNSTRPNHLFHDVAPYDSDSKMFHCYSMHLKLEEIIRWAYMDDILQVVNS